MDYKEEIKKAAERVTDNTAAYVAGALSNEAKDYWYNEFKRQKLQSDSGQDQSLRNQPLKPSECFHGKSEHKSVFSPELIKKLKERGEELKNESVQNIAKMFCDTIKEEYPEALEDMGKEIKQYKDYLDYIKSNPDRPISFDNWKYMVEHYEKPELISKNDIDDVVSKRIGIIGHVDYGCVIIGVGSQMIIPEPIQSIVPIADVIPDKDFILTCHDNAIEATILREKHEMDKPWKVKKQKKENHKRNNKRK